MGVAVPCLPAKQPCALPGQFHRLRPHPPPRQPAPPAKCHFHHHSATTAAQAITARNNNNLNTGSRPFHFDLLLKKMPGSRGSNPASVGGIPRGNGAIRRGKTNAPTVGVDGPDPGTSPHWREGKNRQWVAPVCKGAWDAADTLNRSEASGTQPSALSTQNSFPRTPPTPTLGGAVVLFGTFGTVAHLAAPPFPRPGCPGRCHAA